MSPRSILAWLALPAVVAGCSAGPGEPVDEDTPTSQPEDLGDGAPTPDDGLDAGVDGATDLPRPDLPDGPRDALATDARADAPGLDARDVPPGDIVALDGSISDVVSRDVSGGDAVPSDAGVWAPPVETGAVRFPYRAYRCDHVVRAPSPGVRAAVFHGSGTGAAPGVRNLHLTFAGDPSRSVVVQWSTDAATLASEVRFGDAPGALDRVARGFSFLYSGASGRRQHEVHLCGLLPGRTYYYDAGGSAAGGRSPGYRFVTAPSDASPVRAVVAGDSRTNPSQWAVVARRALAEGPDFMILTGDAVADGANQRQWDALFEASPTLFAQVPTLWTNGNHEYLAEPYLAQFALPDHGGARGAEQWYTLAYGPLRLVALNDTVSAATDVTVAQADFLRATLGSLDRARTPWVLSLHHQPLYTTSSSHGSNTTLRGAWAPLFDRYHVDVDLAGHVHSYETTNPLRGGTASSEGAVVTAARGTRYINFGGGGAPLYGFGALRPWIRRRESTRGYAVLDASVGALRWSARRDDGSLIESFDLNR